MRFWKTCSEQTPRQGCLQAALGQVLNDILLVAVSAPRPAVHWLYSPVTAPRCC